ncbi:glycosyltransferase family 9 protein [Sulfurospirillum sp. 1612]|uniref:glycosyltransferase family 9 protein n=1 Tax=Sulfurospirillum sp. 1612 TaxID=3094835 RepID=UPI002F95673E
MKILNYVDKLLPLFKKRSDKKIFHNILVVSNTGLGDTILATPAIKTLRKNFKDIHITFLIHKNIYPLFENFEYVDDFLFYSRGIINQITLVKQLRKKKIDTIFLLHSNGPEDIFFSILSGACNILKMTSNKNHEYQHIFLNTLTSKKQHIIEEKLDLIRVFKPKIIDTKMEISKKFTLKKGILQKEKNYRYIGLQIGAQDSYKMWPIDKFIELSRHLLDTYSCKLVLLGATALEQKLTRHLSQALEDPTHIINKCGKSSLTELAYITKELDLLITNDTGTMHLAVALQTPTISLFGPTDSKMYGPYQDEKLHDIIQKDGFFVNSVPKKQRTNKGMDLISVAEVIALLERRLLKND